jgi:hypothetical protein
MDVVGDLMRVAVSGNNPIALGKAVGVDKDKAQTLIRVSLPLVLGSMATTAAKPGGTEMVAKMLTQAGASNPIDNLGGFLSNPAAAGGSTMVSSLFGTQTETLQNVIAQKSGVPPAVISKVMAIAAPMVAGYVGKMFIEQKMNPAGLASLLGIQSKMAMQASPEAASLFKELMAIK